MVEKVQRVLKIEVAPPRFVSVARCRTWSVLDTLAEEDQDVAGDDRAVDTRRGVKVSAASAAGGSNCMLFGVHPGRNH